MRSLALLLMGLLLISGCASRTITQQTVRADDIRGIPVVQNPVVADLDVSTNKVTGQVTVKLPINTDMAKQNAIADALAKSHADILIQPVFHTEIKNRSATVTVTGFPGNYKAFRPMDTTDIKRLSVIDASRKADSYEPTSINAEKSSKAGLITAIIIGITGTIILILLLS